MCHVFANKKTINYLTFKHKGDILLFDVLIIYLAKNRSLIMFFNVLDKMLSYLYLCLNHDYCLVL